MAIDLGTAPLGTAVQGGLGQQEIQQKQQQINLDAQQKAGQPIQDVASGVLQKELNKITITPQLAQGYGTVTGDKSAGRMVGMKIDPAIWSAMLAGGAKQAALQERLGVQEDIAASRQGTQEQLETSREEAAAQRETDRETSESQREHDRDETLKAIAELRGSSKGSASTPATAGMIRKIVGADAVPKEIGDNETIPPALTGYILKQKEGGAATQMIKILQGLKNPLTGGYPPDAAEQVQALYQKMQQQKTPQDNDAPAATPNNDPLGINP